MTTPNIITKTDSYKLNHWNQYPHGTENVYSYFEARKGALFPETVFFGLQPILAKNLAGQVVTRQKIEQAAQLAAAHFGNTDYFNRKGWEYILEQHNGRLPLRIAAVDEGTPVPIDNIMMSVENTDPVNTYWLTNAVESVLTHVWYPSTVASLSRETKKIFKRFLDETSDNPGGINFMLHDFGYRGVSSDESAEIGGAAHLVNFLGTDTVPAMELIANYYGKGWTDDGINPTIPDDDPTRYEGIAYSVAATEHSIMTSRGPQGEEDIVDDLLIKYPKGILSVVADSFNIYNFVENIVCKRFKERILARDGVFVVRPDSISPRHPTPEAEVVWIAQTLAMGFGYTMNSKGFMVINPKVRILWGDGIDKNGIEKILQALKEAKFSSENMATFGMGGGLLQKINRDTQRFAFKSSAQKRNGAWYDIYKLPTDLSKASKRGRLALIKDNGVYRTVSEKEAGDRNLLHVVFLNGKLTAPTTFAEVRERAKL
jgi:nicotinamide phosphoribosyltransferase